MELALREAKARLSELVAAAQNGERVVIHKHGEPAVELVRCRGRGGIDFDKLEAMRRRLGIEGDGREVAGGTQQSCLQPSRARARQRVGGQTMRILLNTSYLYD